MIKMEMEQVVQNHRRLLRMMMKGVRETNIEKMAMLQIVTMALRTLFVRKMMLTTML
jgi:hypothetical protein